MDARCSEIAATDTHDLRRRVLRDGDPDAPVDFPDDELEGVFHLGVVHDGVPVAISTWIPRSHPDHPAEPAVQLRGMATDPAERGRGFGSLLLREGVATVRARGVAAVWANARVTVLGFYEAHGFVVEGPEFVTADTGIAHRRVVLRPGPDRSG